MRCRVCGEDIKDMIEVCPICSNTQVELQHAIIIEEAMKIVKKIIKKAR